MKATVPVCATCLLLLAAASAPGESAPRDPARTKPISKRTLDLGSEKTSTPFGIATKSFGSISYSGSTQKINLSDPSNTYPFVPSTERSQCSSGWNL